MNQWLFGIPGAVDDGDLCHVYPFWEEDENYFVSGSNHAGEIRGLMLSGCQVGICASEVNEAALKELLIYAHGGTKVFVDSGAFAEVSFEGGHLAVKQPISAQEWRRRLAIYRRVAEAYRGRCYLVAPDRVGDQEETLRRLYRYAMDVARLAELGANIIVPIQKGRMPAREFYLRAMVILGLPTAIPGIPSKKDATRLEELLAFVRQVHPPRIHLLGLGPKSHRYQETVESVHAARPGIAITCDSVRITALVGRGNGKRRPLTAAQDEARALGLSGTTEVKAAALQKVMMAELRRKVAEAREMGWKDPELDDEPAMAVRPRLLPAAR